MAALATIAELEARTVVDDTDRAQAALDDASAAVTAYTGRSFAAGTPEVVVAIVCAAAIRALSVDPASAGISQETVGPFTRTIGAAAAGGGAGLLKSEKDLLDSLSKRRSGVIHGKNWAT